ncbi:PQQ-binding-like beta-propeller repeat protein [Streptomyces sp. NPDC046866]|uniref:outer membrane protein assembly factor BamB family protein n=1 Tax=Streptomyces sp. NPDC046866 TaxID=3154921 RepID=UPI003451EC85
MGRHLQVAAACAVSAVAVLYAVLSVKLAAVDVSAEAACSAGGCPRGLGWLVLWTLAAGFAAGLLWRAALKGRSPYRSAGGRAAAAVIGFAALVPGWLGFSWLRGPHMDLFGYQAPEGPAAGRPLGSWEDRDTGAVIRVRTDGVTAYDGAGRHGWGLGAPADGRAVCAMSPQTPEHTGILAYAAPAPGGGACGSRLVAVDITTGEQRWTADVPNPAGTAVSAGGSLAVTATADAVIARDLRGGTERWRAPLPGRTDAAEVLAGADRVLVLARSAASGSALLVLDARTGALTWQAPLPAGTDPPRLVSAAPAAVVAAGRLLAFDDRGRPRGAGAAEAPYLPAGEGRRWLVLGDVLVAPAPEQEKREVLAAYSLTDGRLLWRRPLGDDRSVRALGIGRTGRIAVVSRGAYAHLWHLDPATGRPAGESTVLRGLPMGESIALYGRTFVNLDPGGTLPPIFDVDPVLGW